MHKALFLSRNRHNSRYFFRGHVPADLRHHFGGRKEFTIALDTSDKQIAKRKAMALWVESLTIFDELPAALVSDDTPQQKEIHSLRVLL